MLGNKIIKEDINEILNANLPWDYLLGKTILISGANGFLPAYMLRVLLELNRRFPLHPIKIVAVVRNKNNFVQKFGSFEIENLELISQDICEPIKYSGPIDIIIHAASQASPKYYISDPVGTFAPNTIGTYHLLKLAVQKKCERFLFFSSSEAYGDLSSVDFISEDQFGNLNPLNDRACYAESKRMGETMCEAFRAQYNLSYVIVRPFHTYGPGLNLDDGRVFADFISNIINNSDIIMTSDGTAERSFCYLSDATIGFFTVLFLGNNTAYNIGNPYQTISIGDLAKMLINLYPEKNLSIIYKKNDDMNYLATSINRIAPSIDNIMKHGWFPEISLSDGFKRTIEYFLA